MPKNLNDADLTEIKDKAMELFNLMNAAADKLNKMRVDNLSDPLDTVRSCVLLAREASNLGVFMFNQKRMQEQRAEIDRLRAANAETSGR